MASLTGKIEPGEYEIKFSITEIKSDYNANRNDCELPNMYLNIGIVPYKNINKYASKQYPTVFPDLSEINQSLTYDFFLTKTYENSTIPTDKIFSDILFTTAFKFEELSDEMLNFGFSGLWELTFAIRNF